MLNKIFEEKKKFHSKIHASKTQVRKWADMRRVWFTTMNELSNDEMTNHFGMALKSNYVSSTTIMCSNVNVTHESIVRISHFVFVLFLYSLCSFFIFHFIFFCIFRISFGGGFAIEFSAWPFFCRRCEKCHSKPTIWNSFYQKLIFLMRTT